MFLNCEKLTESYFYLYQRDVKIKSQVLERNVSSYYEEKVPQFRLVWKKERVIFNIWFGEFHKLIT